MRAGKLILWSAAACLGVTIAAGAAFAAHGAKASTTTIKAVAPAAPFKINRFVQDTLRWDKDVYKVPSGGTLHVVNLAADEGPHTFPVVAEYALNVPSMVP